MVLENIQYRYYADSHRRGISAQARGYLSSQGADGPDHAADWAILAEGEDVKLVYVAGPYTADTEDMVYQNIHIAREHAVKLWQAGYAVICPHTNTAFMGGVMPEQTFYDGTMEMLKRCDHIFMLPDWEYSKGARAEKEYADAHGITEVLLE
jgi:hypothetical protein